MLRKDNESLLREYNQIAKRRDHFAVYKGAPYNTHAGFPIAGCATLLGVCGGLCAIPGGIVEAVITGNVGSGLAIGFGGAALSVISYNIGSRRMDYMNKKYEEYDRKLEVLHGQIEWPYFDNYEQ